MPFAILKKSILISILADFTEHYATLQATGGSADHLKDFKDTIDMLLLEISLRESINAN
jgi:hypothetical protein